MPLFGLPAVGGVLPRAASFGTPRSTPLAHRPGWQGTRPLAVVAIALGLIGGSYGVAATATNTNAAGSSTSTAAATAPAAAPSGVPQAAPPGATAANPWGNQRSDETLLTGDTLAQVKAAVLAKAGSDATIVRIETDADGNGACEAHLTTSDGTAETVYVDKSFNVVSVETR